MEFVQMTTTTETRDEAQAIADHLVAERLAACVQIIGPIASTYRWEGAIQHSDEFMCVIKTRKSLAGEAGSAIRSLHSYDNRRSLSRSSLEAVTTTWDGSKPRRSADYSASAV